MELKTKLDMQRRLLALFFVLFTLSLGAQETPKAPPAAIEASPSPVSLSPDWWIYFKEASNEELPGRIQSFSDQITRTIDETPKESQERLRPLAQKVVSNLNAYLIARTQALQAEPPIIPTIEAYTLSDLVALSRELRNTELVLQNDLEDFADREKQIEAGDARLRKLWSRYSEIKERTEEKLTLGLQIIDYRVSLEIARIKQANLKKVIEVDRVRVTQARQELGRALEKVKVQESEVQSLQSELENARAAWELEKRQLAEQEATSLARFDFTQRGEKAKLQNQLLSQELTYAAIEEAIAYNNLILKSVQFALLTYLRNPTEESLATLEKESERWKRDLTQLKQSVSEWELSIKRDIQRAEEWLSINIEDKTEDAAEIRRLQEEILDFSERSLVLLIRLQTEMEDTRFILELISGKIVETQPYFLNFWTRLKTNLASAYNATAEVFSQPLFTIGETLVSIGDLVRFFLIVLISFWVATLAELGIGRVAFRGRGIRQSMIYRIKRL
ncbi:MAG: hypothetical protein KDK48_06655, partial [Chlamydiia bacterium]|nr:hypothetical protein [Chlamydiia bacterium]